MAEKGGWKLKEVPVRWVEDPDTRVRFPQDIIKMVEPAVQAAAPEAAKAIGHRRSSLTR